MSQYHCFSCCSVSFLWSERSVSYGLYSLYSMGCTVGIYGLYGLYNTLYAGLLS